MSPKYKTEGSKEHEKKHEKKHKTNSSKEKKKCMRWQTTYDMPNKDKF